MHPFNNERSYKTCNICNSATKETLVKCHLINIIQTGFFSVGNPLQSTGLLETQ